MDTKEPILRDASLMSPMQNVSLINRDASPKSSRQDTLTFEKLVTQ